jgi:hypothetical protein
MLDKYNWAMDWIRLPQCFRLEHGNEPLGSMKCWEILEYNI